jgi:hypothetical protein
MSIMEGRLWRQTPRREREKPCFQGTFAQWVAVRATDHAPRLRFPHPSRPTDFGFRRVLPARHRRDPVSFVPLGAGSYFTISAPAVAMDVLAGVSSPRLPRSTVAGCPKRRGRKVFNTSERARHDR